MDNQKAPRKLWEHPNPKSTAMWRFLEGVNAKHGLKLKTFQDLQTYALTPGNRSRFWGDVFESAGFIHSGSYSVVVDESLPIDAIPRWFEGVSLNFAENMLFANVDAKHPNTKPDDKIAVTEVREGNSAVKNVTYGELRKRTGHLAAAMHSRGVTKGDRVVIVGSNSVDTLVVFLATAWLGGIFSSSSTDMGVKGILQRTVQVDPKLLFMDDAALYNGKTLDLTSKMSDIVVGLKQSCPSFVGCVSIQRFDQPKDVSGIPHTTTLSNFLSTTSSSPGSAVPDFVRIPFHEPFLICYSSGTTGTPKAIVHSVGGVMINYFKEGHLHEGLDDTAVTLQYTTVGWIMYLAATGSLLFGGRTVLYDGSPFQPDPAMLVRLLGEHGVTKFGTSPRWMLEMTRHNIAPRAMVDLSSLRTVTCTGMVLSDQLFSWFYDVGFPGHAHLANISGGTDIAGCFGIMNPLTPVFVGGTQGPSLGVDVRIYDGEAGNEVQSGVPGELVAVQSIPNVPCFFWGDTDPSPGERYRAAYFDRFRDVGRRVWAHGDFCAVHPVTGNIAFLGRADGVLNPSGVRFGSADIYSVIERRFQDSVADSLCVGQRRQQHDNDESVMLFLLMKEGCKMDKGLVGEIKEAIRADLSPRHVPKYIFETPEIPTTINNKKVELPVKQIVSGQTIKPSGSLANPQSLDYYYQFARVEELVEAKGKL